MSVSDASCSTTSKIEPQWPAIRSSRSLSIVAIYAAPFRCCSSARHCRRTSRMYWTWGSSLEPSATASAIASAASCSKRWSTSGGSEPRCTAWPRCAAKYCPLLLCPLQTSGKPSTSTAPPSKGSLKRHRRSCGSNEPARTGTGRRQLGASSSRCASRRAVEAAPQRQRGKAALDGRASCDPLQQLADHVTDDLSALRDDRVAERHAARAV